MQYAVPQFTDVEDKLIGPLTLKQFLALLATGGIILFFWSILGFNIFFFLFALPFGLLGIGLTFGKLNGRSLFDYALPFISYIASPRVMVYHRVTPQITLSKMKKETPKTTVQPSQDLEGTESRLKKLAYLLDQQTAHEKELIENPEIR